MDWKKIYNEKLITVDEAVKHVENGDTIFSIACSRRTEIPDSGIDEKEKRIKRCKDLAGSEYRRCRICTAGV